MWVLNRLGRLADAIEDDGKVWADTCWRMLAEAQERGEWEPAQKRAPATEPSSSA